MKASFLILAVAAASLASAATISSGTNASGGLLAAGALDPFFVVSGPGVTTSAFVVPSLFSCAYYNTGSCGTLGTSSAQWITTSQGANTPVGVFTYTEAFTVGSTSLSGIWGTDNCGTLTVAGGTVTGGSIGSGSTVATCNGGNSANFSTPTAFTISGLTTGNTYNLVFTVVNTDGPSALFVDAGPVGVTPEPSSILSVLTGLGVVGFAIRRRQSAK